MQQRDRDLADFDRRITQASAQGNNALVLDLERQALSQAQQQHGELHVTTALRWQRLARALRGNGETRQAEQALQSALAIRRSCLGEMHSACAALIEELAGLCEEDDDAAQAHSLLLQALAIREQALGPAHSFTREVRSRLQRLQERESVRRFREAMSARHNAALQLLRQEDFAAALAELGQVLAANRQRLGDEHPDTISCLLSLAGAYIDAHQLAQAEPLLDEAGRHLASPGRDDDGGHVQLHFLQARRHRKNGDLAQAQAHIRQAQEALTSGRADPRRQAAILNEAALILARQGRPAEAEALLEQIPASAEVELLAQASTLENRAALAQERGDHAKAAHFRRQALELKRASVGEDTLSFANSLVNQAVAESSLDDPAADCEDLLRQAIHIIEERLGSGHVRLLHPLDALQVLQQRQGDSAAATATGERVEAILHDAGPEHAAAVARLLRRQGAALADSGDVDEAVARYRQAVQILSGDAGSRPEWRDALAVLGHLYIRKGELDAAEAVFRELSGTQLQEDDYSRTVLFSATVWLAFIVHLRDPLQAAALLDKAIALDQRLIAHDFTDPSEDVQSYRRSRRELVVGLSAAIALRSAPHDAAARDRLILLLLRSSSLAEEVLLRRRQLPVDDSGHAIAEKQQALAQLRRQIAQRASAGVKPRWVEAHEELSLGDLRRRELALSAEVLAALPVGAQVNEALAFQLDSVQQHLPHGTALLQIASLQLMEPEQVFAQLRRDPVTAAETVYVAIYIDTQAGGRRLLFELGPAAQIDAQVRTHREMLSLHPRRRTAAQQQALTVAVEYLHKALVAPIEPLLRDCATLIIVPDGALWHLSWAALPAREGFPLLEKFEIRYLTSARELVRGQAALRSASHAPVVIADPDFDLASAQPIAGNPGPGDEFQFGDRATVADGEAGDDLGTKNLAYHAERLPGSRVEGAAVASLLGVDAWMDAQATKSRILALHSPRILHIATHGLYLDDAQAWKNMQFARRFGGRRIDLGEMTAAQQLLLQRVESDLKQFMAKVAADPSADMESGEDELSQSGISDPLFELPDPATIKALEQESDDPMLRSGLLLAGFNTWMSNERTPETIGDGLLSAIDVAGMDLQATELVMLSACNSGVGEVRDGDGVMGLRRAFSIAGAATLIASQWSIPDDATAVLVEDFYGRVAAQEKTDYGAALRDAQLAVRARAEDPFFWGGFVCQGSGKAAPGSL